MKEIEELMREGLREVVALKPMGGLTTIWGEVKLGRRSDGVGVGR